MSKRSKKKRNKKYVPKDGAVTPTQPVVHHFVAETEARRGQLKAWRRWLIVGAIGTLLLALVVWLGSLLF